MAKPRSKVTNLTTHSSMANGKDHIPANLNSMKPNTSVQSESVPSSQVPNGTCKGVPSQTFVNGRGECNGLESNTPQMTPKGVKSDSDKPRMMGRGRGHRAYRKEQDAKAAARAAKPASPVSPGPSKQAFVSSSHAPSNPPAVAVPPTAAPAVPLFCPGGAVPTVVSRTQPTDVPPEVFRNQPPAVCASPSGTTTTTSVGRPQGGARTMTGSASRQPAVSHPQDGTTNTGPSRPQAAAAPLGNGPTPVSTNQAAAAPLGNGPTPVSTNQAAAVHSATAIASRAVPHSLEAPAEDVEVKLETRGAAAQVTKAPAWVGGRPAKAVFTPPSANDVVAMTAAKRPAARPPSTTNGQVSRPAPGRNRKNKEQVHPPQQLLRRGPGKGISNERDKCFVISLVQVFMNLDMFDFWRDFKSLKPPSSMVMHTLHQIKWEYSNPHGKDPMDSSIITGLLGAMDQPEFRNGEHDSEEFYCKLMEQLSKEEKKLRGENQPVHEGQWRQVRRRPSPRTQSTTAAERQFAFFGEDRTRYWTFPLECPSDQVTDVEIQNLKPTYPVAEVGKFLMVVLPISTMKHYKKQCRIHFAETISNNGWLPQSCSALELHAMIFHQGANTDKGHFFSVVKSSGEWVKFDDATHNAITRNQLLSIQTNGSKGEVPIMPFLAVFAPVSRH